MLCWRNIVRWYYICAHDHTCTFIDALDYNKELHEVRVNRDDSCTLVKGNVTGTSHMLFSSPNVPVFQHNNKSRAECSLL